MGEFGSIDEIASKAFALAFFILGNKVKAISVVREALGKLEVAAAAQVKRLYYTPSRRFLWQRARPANSRTKVSLSDLHLLQRLIYIESEPYEREREQAPDAPGEEEMLVYFVKHLIRISIKRNSFYVALGVSRLLHNYSTSETMEIYNVVVQDPERVKDDYYYRSRKGRLMQEIRDRFGELLSMSRGSRGEERFQTLEAANEFVELVAECLRQFSPWHTPCLIPAPYDPTADEIPTLSSAHHGEEDTVEINRIHAVVHPDCYERLTSSLKLEPPPLRLSVPRFNLPNRKNKMSGPNNKPRRPASSLDADEMEALRRILCEQSTLRKATHPSLLSVVVDKVERARLDLEYSGSVSFVVRDSDELVEVRALDGGEGTLLATHLVGGVAAGDHISTAKSEIVLEGGQKLTFELSSERGGRDEGARALIAVSYRETAWLRVAALSWRRLMRRITTSGGFESRPGRAFAKPAFAALLLLLVCASALALYFLKGSHATDPAQLAAIRQQPPVNQVLGDVAIGNVNASPRERGTTSTVGAGWQAPTQNSAAGRAEKKTSRPEASKANIPSQAARSNTLPLQSVPARSKALSSPADATAESASAAETRMRDTDATRSVGSTAGATALSKVRRVFIDVTGERDLSEQTTRLLASSLLESQRLLSTDNKDEADAAFKIKVNRKVTADAASTGKAVRDSDSRALLINVSVRLVNEDGEVIWPSNGKGNGSAYTGTIKDVTDRIARDLLRDVLKSDAQK